LDYILLTFTGKGLHTYFMKHCSEIRSTDNGKRLHHCTRKKRKDM